MAAVGMEVSAFGVAKAYADLLDVILVAFEDGDLKARIEELGIKAVAASIRMDSPNDKRSVAREVLALVRGSCS